MLNISNISVLKGLTQKSCWKDNENRDVQSAPHLNDPDPDKDYQIFDGVQTEPTFAVIVNPNFETCLKVTVSGLDQALIDSNKKCHIEVSCLEPGKFRLVSDSVPLHTLSEGNSPTERTFLVRLENRESPDKKILAPVAFWQNFKWLFLEGDDDDHGLVVNGVPLELYILPNNLPDYFTSEDAQGVPRLLCRMFVGTSTRSGRQTTEEWIEHVVAVVHGSRESSSEGNPMNTEDHWLKYDAWSGGNSFTHHGGTLVFDSKGGDFLLEAWLNAYRNYVTNGVAHLVNCYDQAGAVQVALSLGMDYNKVTWQYHQVFGYIQKSAQLVGWGFCNNPYFRGYNTDKIMDNPKDPKRSGFRNHAFLSWKPDFDPERLRNADKPEWNDSVPDATQMPDLLAIDACAGPHYGNEPVGTYVRPEDMTKSGDSKSNDYWATRDPEFSAAKPNICLFDSNNGARGEGNPHPVHHFLMPGIIGISVAASKILPAIKPFELGIDWADFAPGANSSGNFPGPTSQVLENFGRVVFGEKCTEATRIPIADIRRGDGTVTSETKIYCPDQTPKVYFYSLRITSCPDGDAALEELKHRASQVIMSAHVTKNDFQTIAGNINVLTSHYNCFFVYKSLMVEISGVPRADDKKVPEVALAVLNEIEKLG